MHEMRYTMLVYDNDLLKVIQILYNSEVLINNLIDLCIRLAKAYQQEKDLWRQKIISNLNRDTKEFVPLKKEYRKDKNNNKVDLVINKQIVYYNKRSIKLTLQMNVKSDKKYSSNVSNKETVKI